MSTAATQPTSVTVEFDVPARMRDGVTLRANVYRPTGSGPWPTLLTRLPYGKDDPRLLAFWLDPIAAARQGFMVVVQDTRGRGASEGEWMPFRFEREDGHDTVEWAARLQGSNGRVGMYGVSYFGNSQWMAAVEQPPSLAAIAPALTWSEPLDGLYARGGALELGVTLAWALETGAEAVTKRSGSEEERARRLEALLDDYDRLPVAGYWDLPVHESTVVNRHGVPELGSLRMLSDPSVPSWCRVSGEHDRVTVPSLHIGGWYDIFLQGTLENFAAMTALGRRARLVVGPWGHDAKALSDPIGQRCLGIRGSAHGVPVHEEGDLTALHVAWFRRHLSLEPAPREDPPASPVRIFVMGRNVWRDEDAWPPDRARPEQWYLSAGGTLTREAGPVDDEPTRFVYDPADPAPTLGGHVVMKPAYPPGPFDQAALEARNDVCVFTSEPLNADVEVTGRVRVVLHAESSAPSTDWVARLCDVDAEGRSWNLCDGIVRVADAASACRRYEIDLWSTSNVFLRGHRLRVHVTSSSFPRWDRNLNTGNQHASHFEIARQRIYHDAQRPSYVELPVITG